MLIMIPQQDFYDRWTYEPHSLIIPMMNVHFSLTTKTTFSFRLWFHSIMETAIRVTIDCRAVLCKILPTHALDRRHNWIPIEPVFDRQKVKLRPFRMWRLSAFQKIDNSPPTEFLFLGETKSTPIIDTHSTANENCHNNGQQLSIRKVFFCVVLLLLKATCIIFHKIFQYRNAFLLSVLNVSISSHAD